MGGKKNRPKTKWRKVAIGNADDSADSQTDETPEHSDATQNGLRSHETHSEGETMYHNHYQHPSYEYEPNVYFVKENGFLPFPVAPAPAPPPGEAQEEGGAGCYVNGLWIPNTELFKYGVHPPPPSQPNQSPSMVYHPNVPWVCLRPLSAGGAAQQQQQQAAPMCSNPSNAQYFLYFTRKPPPWFQRQRDGWRRRNHSHPNMIQPSPYWNFNHGAQHVVPPNGDWEREQEMTVRDLPAPCELEHETVDVNSQPYVYPGYSFGQPVFTAPVLPVKQRSTSPAAFVKKSAEPAAEEAEPKAASPIPQVGPQAEAQTEPKTSESSINQKPKKKKKRKKTRSEMEMVPEDSVVEAIIPAKPDHLELKMEAKEPQILQNGDALKPRNSSEDSSRVFECPRPLLEFAESLVQLTLAQVQEELQRQVLTQVTTKDTATDIALRTSPALTSLLVEGTLGGSNEDHGPGDHAPGLPTPLNQEGYCDMGRNVDSVSDDGMEDNRLAGTVTDSISPSRTVDDPKIATLVESFSGLNLPRDVSLDSNAAASRKLVDGFADTVLVEVANLVREELLVERSAPIEIEDSSLETSGEHASKFSSFDDRSIDSIESKDFSYQNYILNGVISDGAGGKHVDDATASYLSLMLPYSDKLLQDTEQELNSLQSRVLAANQSIYKLAYDEVVTDQSETDEPEPSMFIGQETIVRKSPLRTEILVHDVDTASEAGSEDVELIPHRYESSTSQEKHVYVNRLSLAAELLRTHEDLPYDDDFKPVTSEPAKVEGIRMDYGSVPMQVITSGPRASQISTADSGVQSEESGDEGVEEAQEAKDGLQVSASIEDQSEGSVGGRGRAKRPLGPLQGSPWTDPCLCCVVM